ncbi:VOC family protein [Anaerosporobacter faecicola]|uniref:VOC family protein n=1 Tax=Anaerosporobacter faecicola TaxID=2718714 RepID=UPI00143B3F3D|nr:VOC family protein [Anaerosporobacter faecicola]
MELGMTLYIKNTVEAVDFYMKSFGLSLGYHEKFPNGTYMHAELQKDGKTIFAVSESSNDELVENMKQLAKNNFSPTTSCGINFNSEDEIINAYNMLKEEGIVCRPIGPLPWSVCSADVLDKYGVYWYIYM